MPRQCGDAQREAGGENDTAEDPLSLPSDDDPKTPLVADQSELVLPRLLAVTPCTVAALLPDSGYQERVTTDP